MNILLTSLAKGFLLLIIFSLARLAMAETAVIVHPSNTDEIPQSMITQLYLAKRKAFPNGTPVTPLDLTEGSDLRAGFESAVLNKSGSQLQAYWSQLIFTGKGNPPEEKASDADVIADVSSNPAAIGYVDAASVNDSVRVVLTF